MYLVFKMSNRFLATEKRFTGTYFEKELKEYIEDFTTNGTPVTLVENLQDASVLFDIEVSDIEVIQ